MKVVVYTTEAKQYRNGLKFAWSREGLDWFPIGPDREYLHAAQGSWEQGHRLMHPFVLRASDGFFHCVFQIQGIDSRFVHVASRDLAHWGRQTVLDTRASACRRPVIDVDATGFGVTFQDANGAWLRVTTGDWRTCSAAQPVTQPKDPRQIVDLPDGRIEGVVLDVEEAIRDALVAEHEWIVLHEEHLYQEKMDEDPVRFARLGSVSGTLFIDAARQKPISDKLLGIFYEDINYAADGGLYAELVQNRDFEQEHFFRDGCQPAPDHRNAWSVVREGMSFDIATDGPIHPNNPHYAVLSIDKLGAALVNSGWDGIPLKAGARYFFSAFVRRLAGATEQLDVRLVDKGRVVAEGLVQTGFGVWTRVEATLVAGVDATAATLQLLPDKAGRVALDMVSLFPEETFKRRRNGVRADLAQALADLKPRFMRFPGGCVAHGDVIENTYHWKNTVGPIESRKQMMNRWGYHQSMGMGYFEYFQLCEDIGCEPLPVMHAGVTCQFPCGQSAVPMEEMPEVIAEYIDLIEFANGAPDTKWGAVRADMGHPSPFNLRMIGVGNEEQITNDFEERFAMIVAALSEKHPEITVIGTAGPFIRGADYREGWALAEQLQIPLIDEHYYVRPGWFIHNQDFYDRYDRSRDPKIYVGEYAAHRPDRQATVETALAEALHLMTLERNGDIVEMSSYAPLFAKVGFTQWNPNLIYFTNTEVRPSTGYPVQRLFGENAGNRHVHAVFQPLAPIPADARRRIGSSVVVDERTSDWIVKIANLLPVTVSVALEGIASASASKTVLTGAPDDTQMHCFTEQTPVGGVDRPVRLPPYSFAVLRFPPTWAQSRQSAPAL